MRIGSLRRGDGRLTTATASHLRHARAHGLKREARQHRRHPGEASRDQADRRRRLQRDWKHCRRRQLRLVCCERVETDSRGGRGARHVGRVAAPETSDAVLCVNLLAGGQRRSGAVGGVGGVSRCSNTRRNWCRIIHMARLGASTRGGGREGEGGGSEGNGGRVMAGWWCTGGPAESRWRQRAASAKP